MLHRNFQLSYQAPSLRDLHTQSISKPLVSGSLSLLTFSTQYPVFQREKYLRIHLLARSPPTVIIRVRNRIRAPGHIASKRCADTTRTALAGEVQLAVFAESCANAASYGAGYVRGVATSIVVGHVGRVQIIIDRMGATKSWKADFRR
jgi:hypothetical protein